ncbi:TetR/AcrR family transcriptional regulator [Loktanella sp. IMCC34160]|uniref:TetR/AcrR family transcriptional regulator n=1 Tax=Rhodobacterales TaxID=204455 RepID=UPI00101D007F|nr:TetR/AcrR family transcriptional regulator [Loktanella sp. IMCC34160]RYG90595.1 TetR/AcrR family transcriptional regulator [Loktanella sp. IMCC34160]
MARKTEERRAALRETLIDIAERVIRQDGIGALKARDLAKEAGCALGAIYNVFGDLNDLVLEVNARTFRRLGLTVSEALAEAPAEPVAQLIAMSRGYHRFAEANRPAWRAMFDIDRPAGQSAPDWYLAEMARLFAYIDAPLAVLFTDLAVDDRHLLARALFSSVHGIVALGLDEASAGVPPEQIDRMITLILERMTA